MREIETGLVRGYSSGDMIMQGIAGCKTQEADRGRGRNMGVCLTAGESTLGTIVSGR